MFVHKMDLHSLSTKVLECCAYNTLSIQENFHFFFITNKCPATWKDRECMHPFISMYLCQGKQKVASH